MTTKAQNKIAIVQAISDYFNAGVSLNDTAPILSQHGVPFTEIQETIQSVGLEKEWILTPEKVQEKVTKALDGVVLTHFLDVVKLAKNIDMPQLTDQEKQKAIIDFSGVSKSVVKASAKFTQFSNSGYVGNIARWIKSHPDFTPQELHDSNSCFKGENPSEQSPIAKLYFDEFLAYREFFK